MLTAELANGPSLNYVRSPGCRADQSAYATVDEMLPASNAQLIASRIPGARLETLEGVGHMFWWEQPERSAAAIRALIDQGA
jgi:pimeloyl-ACP methyl ester carboxylesterase